MLRARFKLLSFTIALLAALAIFGSFHQVTLARLVACRSDPVVILSDGTIVDVSADIDTLLWNVTEVHYTLHIPEGVSPILVLHTKAWLTSVETFTILSDNPANRFTSTTTVYTRDSNVDVTANMLVNLGYGQKSGVTGQALTIDLSSR